jgi:hypothetical protein
LGSEQWKQEEYAWSSRAFFLLGSAVRFVMAMSSHIFLRSYDGRTSTLFLTLLTFWRAHCFSKDKKLFFRSRIEDQEGSPCSHHHGGLEFEASEQYLLEINGFMPEVV